MGFQGLEPPSGSTPQSPCHMCPTQLRVAQGKWPEPGGGRARALAAGRGKFAPLVREAASPRTPEMVGVAPGALRCRQPPSIKTGTQRGGQTGTQRCFLTDKSSQERCRQGTNQ